MKYKSVHKLLNFCIAIIWMINGLFCKVLNLVPRHQQIVAKILGDEHVQLMIMLIGFSEIFMAIWILSGVKSKLNAITQIIIIAVMNTLEFILVPDLLLWGKANAIFAFILILVIFCNQFYLKNKSDKQN